jgi:plastocyanin
VRKLLAATLLSFVLTSCSDSATDVVELTSGRAFQPGTIIVPVGEVVTFENASDEAHTVTAYEDEIPEGADYFASGDFRSEEAARSDLSAGLIDAGENYEVSFTAAGTYGYFCIPHEEQGMVGTIVVEAK